MAAAAVAARTRPWLLQAWALEMQGKPIEAVNELLKLCLVHRIFLPEEGSPDMEMVARGLEKHLEQEQREYLLKILIGVSSEENRRSLVEALGLEMSAGSVDDKQENTLS